MTSNTNRLDGVDMTDEQLQELYKLARAAHAITDFEVNARALLSASKPAAPKYSKNIEWPEGYCLDPNGVMCCPDGAHKHWSFGYDLGYADALAVRSPATRSADTQDERGVIAPVTVSRTHPNQAYMTLGFGSEDECNDFLRCLNDLYTRKRPRAASTSANVARGAEAVAWTPDSLYDAIEKVLLSHKLHNWQDENENLLGLVDRLCDDSATDISSGQHAIRLICDEIYNEVLTIAAPPAQTANVAPAATVQAGDACQTPFSNCRFQICDLPGQCRGEGKCHHPAIPAASQPVEAACPECGGGPVTWKCTCEPMWRPSAVVMDDERAAFEDVEKKRRHGYGGDTLTRYPDNDEEYLLPLVQARWVGWQARAKEKS